MTIESNDSFVPVPGGKGKVSNARVDDDEDDEDDDDEE